MISKIRDVRQYGLLPCPFSPKITNPIDVDQDLASIRGDEQQAEKLSPARLVDKIFPKQPSLDFLHIIVRKPDTGE